MQEGKTYIGRASLFGKEYMTVYEPIREGNRTIGILFIGTDMSAILGKAGPGHGSQSCLKPARCMGERVHRPCAGGAHRAWPVPWWWMKKPKKAKPGWPN